jgi:hypothetical protein
MLEAGDRVKVADFGIARVTNSADQLTATGGLLGTPSYMSPEQAKGNELDGRSDLFSVGCVLYEMLTGKRAFRGESITGLIFKVITEDPEPMKQLVPNLPPEMERIVSRAMYKAPEGRYQSGRELMEALQPFVAAAGTPTVRQVETPTESLPDVGGDALPTAQVQPTIAAAPTRVASPPPAAPARTPAAAAPSVPRAARETPPAQTARRQGNSGLLIAMALVGMLLVGGLLAGGWYYFSSKTGPTTASNPATPAPPPPTTEAPASLAPSIPPSLATPAPEPSAEPAATATTPTTTFEPPPPSLRPEPLGRRGGRAGGRPDPADVAPAEPATSAGYSHLDDESAGADDVVRRSGDYRSGGGGIYGGARYRVKPKVPQGLMPQERPAVATILHLISAEEAYHNKHERYGALPDLLAAQLALLDVKPSGNAFQRKGYRFSVVIEEDGFRVIAQPLGRMGRPFVGDDTGFVRVGLQ